MWARKKEFVSGQCFLHELCTLEISYYVTFKEISALINWNSHRWSFIIPSCPWKNQIYKKLFHVYLPFFAPPHFFILINENCVCSLAFIKNIFFFKHMDSDSNIIYGALADYSILLLLLYMYHSALWHSLFCAKYCLHLHCCTSAIMCNVMAIREREKKKKKSEKCICKFRRGRASLSYEHTLA